jgi:hypothetical protein
MCIHVPCTSNIVRSYGTEGSMVPRIHVLVIYTNVVRSYGTEGSMVPCIHVPCTSNIVRSYSTIGSDYITSACIHVLHHNHFQRETYKEMISSSSFWVL